MTQERWIKWEPNFQLQQKYNINSLMYKKTEGKMEINLSQTQNFNNKIHVIFVEGIEASRESDGDLMQEKLELLKNQYGTDFYQNWTFFIVENSSFSSWLAEQSLGINTPDDFTHYALITPNLILDVAVFGATEVEFSSIST